jgi:hypothetical protein
MFIVFSLIQSIPKYSADTQSGFILASAGKDGQWGTSDDVFATEKGNAVQGAVNTTQYNLTSLVPSNLQIWKIVLSADKTSVPADGKTTITIQAIGYDKYGNLLPDGTVINFSTTLGTLSSTSAKITNGAATVSISSPNEGTATVTANNGNISSSISLTFTSVINWTGILDFDVLPESLGLGWTFSGYTSYRSISNGILHFKDTGTDSGALACYQLTTKLTSNSQVVVEVKTGKIVSNSDGWQPSFEIADGTYRGIVRLYPGYIVFSGSTNTTYTVDMTVPHVIRLEKNGAYFSVYLDGVQIISNKTGMSAYVSGYYLNRLEFGHDSSAGIGESYWDYYKYAIIKN